MKNIIRLFVFGIFVLMAGGAVAATLTATEHVNVTSDTAATA